MRSNVQAPNAKPMMKSVNKIERNATIVKVIILFTKIDIAQAGHISYKERD